MSNPGFTSTFYGSRDRQVTWSGIGIADEEFDAFMARDVALRLYDKPWRTEFEAHLRGLTNTGFANESLNLFLDVEVPEEYGWAIGESIAEAYLTRKHKVTWPWNMRRDKRNPDANLQGADLVGFIDTGEEVRLVFGEVKTSSSAKTPPNVMGGKHGMVSQIENLILDERLARSLISWLLARCKGTEYEALFNRAVNLFFASGNKVATFFGVLVRDTSPAEEDLRKGGTHLAGIVQIPAICHLIAIYLPCTVEELPMRISAGGGS